MDLPYVLEDIARLVKRNKTKDDYNGYGLGMKITVDSKTGLISEDEFSIVDSKTPYDDYKAEGYDNIPNKLR